MTDASPHDARTAWTVAGSLLVAAALFPLLTQGTPVPGGTVSALLWTASLAVFALGWRRQGSVVARRPLGMIALLVAAAIPPATVLLRAVFPATTPADAEWSIPLSQTIDVVLIAALTVGAVEIARAGVVRGRVRWLPLVVIAVCTVVSGLAWAMVASAGMSQDLASVLLTLMLVPTIGELIVGLTAVVLAQRMRPAPASEDASVQVYPPAG